ncbi:MAG: HEAT repeat domain-containing protein, partial [Planctomycetaceae bacterium]
MRQCIVAACLVLMSWSSIYGADQRVAEIIKGLSAQSAREQLHAATQAAELGPLAVEAVPALVRASKSTDLAVQHETIIALGRIGPDASSALPRLVELLSAESIILKYSACQSLRSMGSRSNNPAAIRALRRVASAGDSLVAVPAAWALVSMRPNDGKILEFALPILTAGLKSASSHVVADAVGALGQIGRPAVSVVLDVMKSGNAPVICSCCDTLAGMGLDGEPAVGPLIAVTRTDDARACRHAARALGMIGCLPKSSVPALSRLLSHSDTGVRINAAQALGAFSSESASAVTDLVQALGSNDSHLKR